jgi:AcrR family transcriptional regulator
MPKISDDRRADRRRQIAQAALRCFIRKGFEATSMADIIAEAGMSAGAIYLHFENKQDLTTQVIREVLQERAGEFAELGKRRPLPDPATVLRQNLEGFRRNPAKAAIQLHLWSTCAREPSLAELLEEFSGEMRRLFQGYLEAWLIEQGLDLQTASERAALLAHIVVGLRQGYVVQSGLVPAFDADGYLDALELIDFSGRRS